MGEFAEMILDGMFCEGCGCFIDAEGKGHPGLCEDCFDDEMKSEIK